MCSEGLISIGQKQCLGEYNYSTSVCIIVNCLYRTVGEDENFTADREQLYSVLVASTIGIGVVPVWRRSLPSSISGRYSDKLLQ